MAESVNGRIPATRPIATTRLRIRPGELILGFHGDHVDFDWKPYHQRSPEHQALHDRLLVSIFHHGVKKPVITHRGHVLVGQRRVEIARRLYPDVKLDCIEIEEDVARHWTEHDVFERLPILKAEIGEVPY